MIFLIRFQNALMEIHKSVPKPKPNTEQKSPQNHYSNFKGTSPLRFGRGRNVYAFHFDFSHDLSVALVFAPTS